MKAPSSSAPSLAAAAERAPDASQHAAFRRGLVDVVRDFVAVHQGLSDLTARFRSGTLRFETVRALVADDESSPLFRLKERVHALFRGEDGPQPRQGESLRRGEALFDLAVGSLFHEALKFRENFYQLEVYAPRVLSLRDAGEGDSDELLGEFEKILRGASERVKESLDEAQTLLGQMRRQLLVLLVDAGEEKSAGLVARYLIAHRDDIETVYPEGLEALLAKLHGDVATAYLCAIRSQLDSARFDEAIALIDEARSTGRGGSGDDVLEPLHAYALGMQAFLTADYLECAEQLDRWLELAGERAEPAHVELARAALSRVPALVEGTDGGAETKRSTRVAKRLAALQR